MIARIWRGISLNVYAEQCLHDLLEKVVPAYQIAEGNKGIFVFRDSKDELVNFLLLSFWDSHDSLLKFTEPMIELARKNPDEEILLFAYEAMANHYDVLPLVESTVGK